MREFRAHPAWRYRLTHIPSGTVHHRVWKDEDIDRDAMARLIERWNAQQPETWRYELT